MEFSGGVSGRLQACGWVLRALPGRNITIRFESLHFRRPNGTSCKDGLRFSSDNCTALPPLSSHRGSGSIRGGSSGSSSSRSEERRAPVTICGRRKPNPIVFNNFVKVEAVLAHFRKQNPHFRIVAVAAEKSVGESGGGGGGRRGNGEKGGRGNNPTPRPVMPP